MTCEMGQLNHPPRINRSWRENLRQEALSCQPHGPGLHWGHAPFPAHPIPKPDPGAGIRPGILTTTQDNCKVSSLFQRGRGRAVGERWLIPSWPASKLHFSLCSVFFFLPRPPPHKYWSQEHSQMNILAHYHLKICLLGNLTCENYGRSGPTKCNKMGLGAGSLLPGC